MNKALIAPVAAIIVALVKQWMGIELEPAAVETTINTILLIIGGIGIFMHPKKKEVENQDSDVNTIQK